VSLVLWVLVVDWTRVIFIITAWLFRLAQHRPFTRISYHKILSMVSFIFNPKYFALAFIYLIHCIVVLYISSSSIEEGVFEDFFHQLRFINCFKKALVAFGEWNVNHIDGCELPVQEDFTSRVGSPWYHNCCELTVCGNSVVGRWLSWMVLLQQWTFSLPKTLMSSWWFWPDDAVDCTGMLLE